MAQTSVSTNLVAAIAGALADDGRDMNLATYVSQETTLQIPFGVAVMQGSLDYGDNLLTAGNVLNIVGVVAYSSAYQVGKEIGSVADSRSKLGILSNVLHNVVKRGRVWVTVEEAVTPASAVRVRCTTAGTGAGSFRTSSAGSGLSMLLVGARYLDTAAINGFARVEFDVLQRSSWTAD